jgi:hypothetical protein
MADNEIKLLLEYIELLEAELKDSNPERFQELIQKRDRLSPALRSLVSTLFAAHQSNLVEINKLQTELFALRAELKARKAAPQDRPSGRRK